MKAMQTVGTIRQCTICWELVERTPCACSAPFRTLVLSAAARDVVPTSEIAWKHAVDNVATGEEAAARA